MKPHSRTAAVLAAFALFALALPPFAAPLLSAQVPVFPPELRWWLEEARKANPAISLDSFMPGESSEEKIEAYRPSRDELYPVFKRWNYSGDRFAYYDLGVSLKKEKDGRYSVSGDVDSYLGVFNRDGVRLFSESYGSAKGIDGLCWTRDSVLVAVGHRITTGAPDADGEFDIDLFIREFTFAERKVTIREYILERAFDGMKMEGLKLRWTEQREDYFAW